MLLRKKSRAINFLRSVHPPNQEFESDHDLLPLRPLSATVPAA